MVRCLTKLYFYRSPPIRYAGNTRIAEVRNNAPVAREWNLCRHRQTGVLDRALTVPFPSYSVGLIAILLLAAIATASSRCFLSTRSLGAAWEGTITPNQSGSPDPLRARDTSNVK